MSDPYSDGLQPRAWQFDSGVTRSDGIRVQVSITVPAGAWWPGVGDTAEIAQMTVTRALSQITDSQERPPF